MIAAELKAQIRHWFHAEHWKVGTIVTQLGLHPDTVRRKIQRFCNLLEAGQAIPEYQRPDAPTLAEWIRHCRRTGLHVQGKLLYERGGDLDALSEQGPGGRGRRLPGLCKASGTQLGSRNALNTRLMHPGVSLELIVSTAVENYESDEN